MSIKCSVLSLKPSVSRHLVAKQQQQQQQQQRATTRPAAKTTHDSYIEFRSESDRIGRPGRAAVVVPIKGSVGAWPRVAPRVISVSAV